MFSKKLNGNGNYKHKHIFPGLCIILFLFTLTFIAVASADDPSCTCGDICVNTSGWWRAGAVFNASNTPIQHAINNAIVGETICVKDGTYSENAVVNKSLTLKGIGMPAVDAGGSGSAMTVTADGCTLEGFNATGSGTDWGQAGIRVESDGNTIKGNNCSNNQYGIYLEGANNNIIKGNNCSNNLNGVYFPSGIRLASSNTNVITGNTCSGNNCDGITLCNSGSNAIIENICSNNRCQTGTCVGAGIDLYHNSNSNIIRGNNCSSNRDYGICLRASTKPSENNIIEGNNCSDNHWGFYLYEFTSNTIMNNTCLSNQVGIGVYHSSNNNTLTNNSITNNTNYGIWLNSSSNNTLHNNYFNNTNNAYDDGNNTWNITKTAGPNIIGGSYLGGNYWNNYAGEDLDGDGLGDTLLPYNSSENIQNGGDYLPLVISVPPALSVHNLNTGENFSTIQAAIYDSNTTVGHTITVDAGTYNENVRVNKSLTIRSTSRNPADTIVNASNSSKHVFHVTVDYVNISGFMVTGATGTWKAGIYLDSNVDHCNISDNNASSNNYYGICLFVYSNNNTLINNTANSNNFGIYLSHSSNNRLTNNTANSNNYGIDLYSSSSNTLTNNTVNSSDYQGISLWYSSNNNLTNNAANSNNCGIYLYNSSNYNTLTSNTANSNNWKGIYLNSSSNNTIYNNYFNNTNNAYDDGNNTWNITKTAGTNIIGGSWLGGNYWSDYEGEDLNGDGLGDTLLPYNSSENIQNGGDYLPLVSVGVQPIVTSLTITPVIGITGQVSAYNITVNTTGFTSLNITIPAGFSAKTPSGGELIARADLWWNESDPHYGYVTFTANTSEPSNKMDVHADIGGASAALTEDVNYTEGATTSIKSPFGSHAERANLTLPTASQTGYLNLSGLPDTITNVTVSIGDFVQNPDSAGSYIFTAKADGEAIGKSATVTIVRVPSTYYVSATDGDDTRTNTEAQDPDTPWKTIQHAIDDAISGDTIIVKDGIYEENVDVTVDNLTLRSENGYGSTIVNASDQNDHVFEVTADYVNISGFTVQNATGDWIAGIYLESGVDHCNISDNNATGNHHGIYLNGIFWEHSGNNTLTNNTANSNTHSGIHLFSSSNNTLTKNTMSGNTYNFDVGGYDLSKYIQNIDTSNKVDGKPIYYLVNQQNQQIPNDAGFVGIVNSTNITVRDLTLTKNGEGVLFVFTNDSRIENVTASNNIHGIHLYYSSNNTLTNNIASDNDFDGIFLRYSSNNTLRENTANLNFFGGIALFYSSNNNDLYGNTANSNEFSGINLYSSSSNNTLTNNTASNNKFFDGISLDGSRNNMLANNTACNNNDGISITSISFPPFFSYNSTNNILTNNFLFNNTRWDFYSDSNSTSNKIYNNTINQTTVSFTYNNGIALKSVPTTPSDPVGLGNIGKYLNITNTSANSWIYLNISYTNADVTGVGEAALKMYSWNGTAWEEVLPPNGVNTTENYVYANITSFSIFAPFGISTAPPVITSFAPPSPVTDTEGATRIFNVTVSQTVNVSWQINGTEVQTNTSVTEASYTNTSAVIGTWNVSALVNNTNGTAIQTWIWTVEAPSPCYIATATYGTPLDKNIDVLRDFRDDVLMTNPIGEAFVSTYYGTSPPIADALRENDGLRTVTRFTLITPLVYLSKFALNGILLVFILGLAAGLLLRKDRKKILKSLLVGTGAILGFIATIFSLGFVGYAIPFCAVIGAYMLPFVIPLSVVFMLGALLRLQTKGKKITTHTQSSHQHKKKRRKILSPVE